MAKVNAERNISVILTIKINTCFYYTTQLNRKLT